MRSTLVLLSLLVACTPQLPEPRPEKPRVEPAPQPLLPAEPRVELAEVLALRESGDEEAARTALDALLLAEPDHGLALLERAEMRLHAGGDMAEALLEASRAAALLPDNPRAHRVLGQVLEETGEIQGASAAYARSLELRSDESLLRRLAGLEKRSGRAQVAVRLWEGLLERSPEDVGAQLELAELYEQVDRPASAEAAWREVVRLSPLNAPLRRRFAAFLERQGKRAEARKMNAEADLIDPPPEERVLRPLQPSRR